MGKPALKKIACLDEDEMVAFVSGSLDKERREIVIGHVDECEDCRSLAAVLAADEHERSLTKESLTDSDLPPPSDHFVIGSVIDERFELLGTLGRGAMGSVYRVRDQQTGKDVALKLLHDLTQDKRAFERELKVGRKVNHPNVCRLHDAGTYDGVPYITMELVEGENLAVLLKREEELALSEALSILIGVASGLAAVHGEGIVHRDLKPANVMIERATGNPVLTDFGFATDLEAKQSKRLVGTPSFWAPEQARGEAATPASDVYSFGVLAYRLLTGKEFSLSKSDMSPVPRQYRAFVARCLEPRPSNRFENGAALVRALTSRRPPVIALVAVAAALVICGFAFTKKEPAPPPPASSVSVPEPAASISALVPQPPPLAPAPAPAESVVVIPTAAAAPKRPLPLPKPSASAPKPPPAPENDPLIRR